MAGKIPQERLNRYLALDKEDSLGSLGGSPEVAEFMARAYMEGMDFALPTYRPTNSFFGAPHTKDLSGVDIACVGIPMDMTLPNKLGSNEGPNAIRDRSFRVGPIHSPTNQIPFEMCNIVDFGDIGYGLPEVSAKSWMVGIEEAYRKFADAGIATLSFGGEHTITYPILKALGQHEPLAVIHIDAHGDTAGSNPELEGTMQAEEYNDTVVFRRAVLDGAIDPENTIQIGIRGAYEFAWEFSHNTGMRVINMVEFEEMGVDKVLAEARRVVGNRPVYVTVDLDGIDPADMPGVAFPEAGGITFREISRFLRGLRGLNIVGADIAELNPSLDPQGTSVVNASAIAFELLTLLAESQVKRRGTRNKTHWNK
ncbi:agmatinase [Pseudomaricurvus alkylphenolicus]|jgi:agmatinase|uniref:arginase family protein n=1 Tax=Pseudomaricurvus alkylphenolicus TaxID=1306991 RepID=UPI001420BA78|nr:arginase family protein [Pseudomaricurvus alkylphenolicus]NIB38544.1 agmatinase [Pseudomaricurvus alkylphenolicus]